MYREIREWRVLIYKRHLDGFESKGGAFFYPPLLHLLFPFTLLEYCRLDTYAMVRLWQHFAGRYDLKL